MDEGKAEKPEVEAMADKMSAPSWALKDTMMKQVNSTALRMVTVAAVMGTDLAVVPMAEIVNDSLGG